jgi:hypothetical protein
MPSTRRGSRCHLHRHRHAQKLVIIVAPSSHCASSSPTAAGTHLCARQLGPRIHERAKPSWDQAAPQHAPWPGSGAVRTRAAGASPPPRLARAQRRSHRIRPSQCRIRSPRAPSSRGAARTSEPTQTAHAAAPSPAGMSPPLLACVQPRSHRIRGPRAPPSRRTAHASKPPQTAQHPRLTASAKGRGRGLAAVLIARCTGFRRPARVAARREESLGEGAVASGYAPLESPTP